MADPTIDEAAVASMATMNARRALNAGRMLAVQAEHEGMPNFAEGFTAMADALEALLDDPVRQVVRHPRFGGIDAPLFHGSFKVWIMNDARSGFVDFRHADTPEAACAAALAALQSTGA